MSILIADITDNIERLKVEVREPSTAETLNLAEKQQYADEEYLIANNQICGIKELNKIEERISGLEPAAMKKDVETQFYNAKVMKDAMCTMESVIYAPPHDIGTNYHNQKIKDYLMNLHQIGSESVNGYAMLGDFDGIKDFFIEKVSQNPKNDLLIHELVVGLYGTNKLRTYIPNFSYIYGGFKCSPSLINPNTKELSSWCLTNENLVNYVLYENVAPAVSMNDYVAKCSVSQFLNTYMQVLYSLRLAHKMIDYTHYDLHGENILIRQPKTGGQFQILYETENGNEYIVADKISSFIDYGSSHIKTKDIYNEKGELVLKGRHFGSHGLIPYSIYPNRSFIMYDAYRLLMACMGEAYREQNFEVYYEIVKIFKFFNDFEDPIDVMTARDTSILPLIEKTVNLQLDDLIRYIRSVCNCDFIKNQATNGIAFLDCEEVCPTEEAILEDFGITDDIPIPTTVLELYDLIRTLQQEDKDVEEFLDNFDYISAMDNHMDETHMILNNLAIEINAFNNKQHLILSNLTYGELFTIDTLSAFREQHSNIGELFNLIDKFYHYTDTAIEIAEIYGDANTLDEVDGLLEDETIATFDNMVVYLLTTNAEYLDNIPVEIERTVTGRDGDIVVIDGYEVKQDRRLSWYWEQRPIFDDGFFHKLGY